MAKLGDVGGELCIAVKDAHPLVAPVPGECIGGDSSGPFVLVIWAFAMDGVVRGGAVAWFGVNEDVRIRLGGPCMENGREVRIAVIEGGREDGAVFRPSAVRRWALWTIESKVGTELGPATGLGGSGLGNGARSTGRVFAFSPGGKDGCRGSLSSGVTTPLDTH